MIFNVTWKNVIDAAIWKDLCKHRWYNPQSVQDLLRAMRNKKSHYHELDAEIQGILGDTPESFLDYFLSRFPSLFSETYFFARASRLLDERRFMSYK